MPFPPPAGLPDSTSRRTAPETTPPYLPGLDDWLATERSHHGVQIRLLRSDQQQDVSDAGLHLLPSQVEADLGGTFKIAAAFDALASTSRAASVSATFRSAPVTV